MNSQTGINITTKGHCRLENSDRDELRKKRRKGKKREMNSKVKDRQKIQAILSS